jgi:hypothetical protein
MAPLNRNWWETPFHMTSASYGLSQRPLQTHDLCCNFADTAHQMAGILKTWYAGIFKTYIGEKAICFLFNYVPESTSISIYTNMIRVSHLYINLIEASYEHM